MKWIGLLMILVVSLCNAQYLEIGKTHRQGIQPFAVPGNFREHLLRWEYTHRRSIRR